MENTFFKLAQAENSRKLDFLTQSIQTLDIQLVLVLKSDSACRETPKSVEFVFIDYEGVLKQSSSFPVRTLSLPPPNVFLWNARVVRCLDYTVVLLITFQKGLSIP